MTRDEILTMEAGREMDALIAREVMGWSKIVLGSYGHWVEEDGSGAYTTKHQVGDWCPSEDIAAAWQVVEKLRERNFYSQHTDLTLTSGVEHWSWTFINHEPLAVYSVKATAPTAALAICFAALLAVMECE
jgi:hypothetical protein